MPEYVEILLLVHIGSAIAGFGPTYAFSILGPLAAKNPGPSGITILESIVAIQKRLVVPAALVIQPLSGILLIFEAGWNDSFFSHTWLWISILLYIGAIYLGLGVQLPRIQSMVKLAKDGKAQTPEFGALAGAAKKTGPVLSVMLTVIIILMVLKPGS